MIPTTLALRTNEGVPILRMEDKTSTSGIQTPRQDTRLTSEIQTNDLVKILVQ